MMSLRVITVSIIILIKTKAFLEKVLINVKLAKEALKK